MTNMLTKTPQIIKAEVIFFDNEDMFYLILILEMSWFQKFIFQNPRDFILQFTS